MSFDCGMKPRHSEETSTGTGRNIQTPPWDKCYQMGLPGLISLSLGVVDMKGFENHCSKQKEVLGPVKQQGAPPPTGTPGPPVLRLSVWRTFRSFPSVLSFSSSSVFFLFEVCSVGFSGVTTQRLPPLRGLLLVP